MNVRDKRLNVWAVSVLAYLKLLSRLSHEEAKQFQNGFSQDVRLPGRNSKYFPKIVVALPVEEVRKMYKACVT